MELSNIWKKIDDEKFEKVMVRKQGFIIAESEKKGNNNSFFKSTIDKIHLLLNQPILLLVISNEILFFLTNISRTNIFFS